MELEDNEIKMAIIKIFKDVKENIIKWEMGTIQRNKQDFQSSKIQSIK